MYSKVNLFIRSLLFNILSVTSIVLFSFVCLFSLLTPLKYRHAAIRIFLRWYLFLLKVVCHIDYQVYGLENIPKDKNGIVLSKHQSTFETFLLPLLFHDPAVIVKRELLWIPFFGWGLAAADPISINRSDKASAMQQVTEQGRKALDEGRWMILFPEGTRIPYGVVGKYRLGGGRLAAATGYPVLPVAHNAGRYWPKRGFIKKPGTVTMVIGPMMESTGRTPDDIMDQVATWIEDTIAKIDKK